MAGKWIIEDTPAAGKWVIEDAPEVGADDTAYPIKIGKEAFPDTLRQVLRDANWGTRNIAAAGTAVTNLWEGVKQFAGQQNNDTIANNRIIRDEAPVGAFAGDVALTAMPFSAAGKSIKAAAAVGAGYGATLPVENATGWQDVAKGKALNTVVGGVTGAGGQWVSNKATSALTRKIGDLALRKSQNAVKDATLSESIAAGYKLPPSMMPDSGVTARILEGVSGKYKTNQLAGINNQEVTNKLARSALGLAEDSPLTKEAMQKLRTAAYKSGYDPVTTIGQINTDKVYSDAMNRIVEKYQGAARSFPGAASDDVMNAILGKEVGGSPGKSVFIDSFGDIVKDVKIPPEPKLRSLLAEIKRAGGINKSELADLGLEKVDKAYPGLFRKDGGMKMDRLLETLDESGWMAQGQVDDLERNGVGGAHEYVRDMIRGAFAKDLVIHPGDWDAYTSHADALKTLSDRGIKQIKIPGREAKIVGGVNVETFDAGDAIRMTQILRDEASSAFASGQSGLGKAKREAADAIESQIERQLFAMGKNGGDLLRNFKESRKLMAKAHDVGDAIREGSGAVNAKTFGAKLQRGKPLTGGLATIGKFANTFGDVAGIPQSGHANPFTIMDAGYSVAGGALNPLAYTLPLARVAARYGLLSNPVQRAVSSPTYAVSPAARMGSGLLGYAPIGGTVLGLNALNQ
jgi:hypothetical protein